MKRHEFVFRGIEWDQLIFLATELLKLGQCRDQFPSSGHLITLSVDLFNKSCFTTGIAKIYMCLIQVENVKKKYDAFAHSNRQARVHTFGDRQCLISLCLNVRRPLQMQIIKFEIVEYKRSIINNHNKTTSKTGSFSSPLLFLSFLVIRFHLHLCALSEKISSHQL